MLQSLPSKLSVIEIAIAVRELLIKLASHQRLVVFLSQAGAPVQSCRGFGARGIERNLFFESLLSVGIASLAQGEPGCFPVCVGSARAVRETLLGFAKCVEGLIVFMMNQVQIGSRDQRLLEPWACWRRLAQLIDGAVESFVVVGGEIDLTQQVEAMRVDFSAFASNQGQNRLGVAVTAAAMQRVGQGQLYQRTIGRAAFVDQCAIFV